MAEELRVGVIGAGRWAMRAHLPGWTRDRRCRLMAICDMEQARAEEAANAFSIPDATDDYRRLLERDDIDVIDVVTGDRGHFPLSWAALEAGKHVLCEKPVAHDFRDTLRARDLARSRGLKTKLGFTFRYSPAMQYMKELIDAGYVGTPFIFNGYEQNSQWIDPGRRCARWIPEMDQSSASASPRWRGYGARDHQPGTLVHGRRCSRPWWAPCATSCQRAYGAGHRQDDAA